MNFEIRRAGEADLAAVRALLHRTWHATFDRAYGADRVEEITRTWHSDRALMMSFARADAVSLVAVSGGEVIGHAFAAVAENGVLILHRLYIAPERQGSGVGSALVDAVVAAFPGAKFMSLEVEQGSRKAIRFYERKGFRIVRTVSAKQGDTLAIPVFIMEKQLAEGEAVPE